MDFYLKNKQVLISIAIDKLEYTRSGFARPQGIVRSPTRHSNLDRFRALSYNEGVTRKTHGDDGSPYAAA
jgi:hypothetical protein